MSERIIRPGTSVPPELFMIRKLVKYEGVSDHDADARAAILYTRLRPNLGDAISVRNIDEKIYVTEAKRQLPRAVKNNRPQNRAR